MLTSLRSILVWGSDGEGKIFLAIFLLRYFRFIGHVVGYYLYKPSNVTDNEQYGRDDVSVILPTVEPTGPDFEGCVRSILQNKPAALFVVTVGETLLGECNRVLSGLNPSESATKIWVSALSIPSKRMQVSHAIPRITTAITILADDHVFWKSEEFLPGILAPFKDESVGVVAPVKRVLRTTPGKLSWKSIINFVACNYLERHNWELRASNAIDGGVFVVSGRTAAYRTNFLQSPGLLGGFCAEKFFFGLFGGKQGLGPDDDNFLTREAFKQGLKIKFQDSPDAVVETTLGEWPKFRGQLIRWARTTFRSNPVMLRRPHFFARYTWSFFMVYFAGLVNFALLWDSVLILTAYKAYGTPAVCILAAWMILTKTVKLLPHFARHPKDLLLLPAQIAFGYIHSVIKFWALVTFWDCDWSGRNLDEIATAEQNFEWAEVEQATRG